MAREFTEDYPRFFVCRTCGRFSPWNTMQNGGYCSTLCMTSYAQCVTCGRYLPEDALYNEHFCGPECAAHYRFLKTLGPKPVVITRERLTHEFEDDIVL